MAYVPTATNEEDQFPAGMQRARTRWSCMFFLFVPGWMCVCMRHGTGEDCLSYGRWSVSSRHYISSRAFCQDIFLHFRQISGCIFDCLFFFLGMDEGRIT